MHVANWQLASDISAFTSVLVTYLRIICPFETCNDSRLELHFITLCLARFLQKTNLAKEVLMFIRSTETSCTSYWRLATFQKIRWNEVQVPMDDFTFILRIKLQCLVYTRISRENLQLFHAYLHTACNIDEVGMRFARKINMTLLWTRMNEPLLLIHTSWDEAFYAK